MSCFLKPIDNRVIIKEMPPVVPPGFVNVHNGLVFPTNVILHVGEVLYTGAMKHNQKEWPLDAGDFVLYHEEGRIRVGIDKITYVILDLEHIVAKWAKPKPGSKAATKLSALTQGGRQ